MVHKASHSEQSKCLNLVTEIESETETQILTIHVKVGDTGAIMWVKTIIAMMVLAQTREVTECV